MTFPARSRSIVFPFSLPLRPGLVPRPCRPRRVTRPMRPASATSGLVGDPRGCARRRELPGSSSTASTRSGGHRYTGVPPFCASRGREGDASRSIATLKGVRGFFQRAAPSSPRWDVSPSIMTSCRSSPSERRIHSAGTSSTPFPRRGRGNCQAAKRRGAVVSMRRRRAPSWWVQLTRGRLGFGLCLRCRTSGIHPDAAG